MARDEVRRPRKKRSDNTTTRSKDVARDGSSGERHATGTRPKDAEELRTARLEHLAKMKYVGEVVTKEPVRARSSRSTRSSSDRIKKQSRTTTSSTRRHHRERKSTNPPEQADSSDDEYVYGKPETNKKVDNDSSTRVSSAVEQEDNEPRPSRSRRTSTRDIKMPEPRRMASRRQSEPVERRNVDGIDLHESSRAPPTSFPSGGNRPTLRRGSTSIRDSTRTPLKGSATIGSSRTEVSLAPSTTVSADQKKPTGLFSKLLRTPAPAVEEEISCLTCGSDDIPKSKSVKLACEHRMCHTCIKRIFNMSVKDPAHMPPRCCTTKHIPLTKVEKLFTRDFQKIWIRKYDEYKTRNRIYCPARGCGEWIDPDHIFMESGRKVGKCKRCNMRVCATCNMRMHNSKDCPKDPATQQFVEIAKEQGWRKCFNCSAMVELKEGCNHMTCRCTAEFCMVCGLKWKSCDCPWFNYEQIDAHLGNPARYQEELERRRDQERRDEVLARRIEVLGMDDQMEFGLGNMAGHHMNQNFIQQAREALTANYQVAEQAARGLLNGLVTGRENQLPGMPEAPDQTATILRHGSRRETTGPPPVDVNSRLTRHGTARRRSAGSVNTFDRRPQTAQDRRIQDWLRPTQA